MELNDGLDIQNSSANMMSYMIQDLLDFSQIKAGKFRKNIQAFNVRDAVNDVMRFQQKKAQDQGVEFFATFEGIAMDSALSNDELQSPIIVSDQDRVK